MKTAGRLKGKVAVITGAASGIGRAIAVRFAKEGADVVIFDRDRVGGIDTVDFIRKIGGKALFSEVDVSNSGEVSSAFAAAIHTHGAVDILVNNAAIEFAGTVEETSETDWERVIRNNLQSVFSMLKANHASFECT